MARALRLLKFDSAHPIGFLQERQAREARRIAGLDLDGYYRWVMDLQIGLSDFLTRPMNDAGWTAREVFAGDPVYVEKLCRGNGTPTRLGLALRHLGGLTLKQAMRFDWSSGYARRRREWILREHVRRFRPDVILAREPSHVDGRFFDQFREHCLFASVIACNTNHAVNWSEHRSDVIFTLTTEYETFFCVQGIESHRFDYGVDPRVAEGVAGLPKVHDCTFVGYLGQPTQRRKSELFEEVAARIGLKWWGVKGPDIARYPHLEAAWQGEAAGREMFRIYKQSRVVLNDYVDMAAGQAVNLRIKEVLGVGTMLLTRGAPNLAALEREGALATFRDAEDCVKKATHFLSREDEREAVAAKGFEVALRDFNYRDIAARFMEVLGDAWERKRPRLAGWN
jgi:hypothetical protein